MNKKENSFWSATLEVAFIVFLFYSNLLMGEYNSSAQGQTKGLLWAIGEVVTIPNFIIAIISATIGHFFFDYMRNYSSTKKIPNRSRHKHSTKERMPELEEMEMKK